MDLRSASSKNHYELLGLSQNASTQEVRLHYHELARVYHPDSNYYSDIASEKVSPEQVELFKIITAAYQTLIDPKKRKEYDALIAPAINEKIRIWEEKDSFWDKQAAFGTAAEVSTTRQRSPTFGQTTAVSREELNADAPAEESLHEIIRSHGRQKVKRVLIKASAVLLGLALISVIAFRFIPKATSKQQIQTNSPQQKYQAPASNKSRLD